MSLSKLHKLKMPSIGNKNSWLWALFLLSINLLPAQKSLWQPPTLAQMDEARLQEIGIKIAGETLYHPDKGSLTDAVVHIGNQCSGTIISEQGLVLTIGNCATGASFNTTFWARKKAEEIPLPGLSVTFTIRTEDVTQAVLKDIPTELPEKLRRAAIAGNIREIEQSIPRTSHQNARIHPFFRGNQYQLFITETFRDIRLVAKAPEMTEEGNSLAPTLPGFSLLRIYADAGSRPADFSENNIPYRPRQCLSISASGPKSETSYFTMGFPEHSDLHLPATGLELQTEVLYPARIEVLNEMLTALKSGESTVLPNREKLLRNLLRELETQTGTLEGLLASRALTEKYRTEGAFYQKLDTNEVWQNRYGQILTQLEREYDRLASYATAKTYVEEIAYRRVGLFKLFNTLRPLMNLYERFGVQPLQSRKGQLLRAVENFYAGYSPETDRAVLAGMLELYYKKLPVDLLSPEVIEQVHLAEKDFQKLASFLFIKTELDQPDPLLTLLEEDIAKALSFVREDPVYALFRQMIKTHEEKVMPAYQETEAEIERLMRLYLEARLVLFPERRLIPDASGALRISIGELHGNLIFLEDLNSEKDVASSSSFLPGRKGPFTEDGKLPLFFSGNAHTMTGFEGGPVLDAGGNLLGIQWERSPDGTIGHLFYDSEEFRSTILDIRYVMSVAEENIPYLLKEMKLLRP